MQRLILGHDPGVEFVLSAGTVRAPATPQDKARVERQLGEWRLAAEGGNALALRTYAAGLEALLLVNTSQENAGKWHTTLKGALGHGPVRYTSLAADYTVVTYALAMAKIGGDSSSSSNSNSAGYESAFVLRRSVLGLYAMMGRDSVRMAETRRLAYMCEAGEFYDLAAAALEDVLNPKPFVALRQLIHRRSDRSLESLVKSLEERAAYIRAESVRVWLRQTTSIHAFEAVAPNIEKLRALSTAYAAFAIDLDEAALGEEARGVREELRHAHIALFSGKHKVNLDQYKDSVDISTTEKRLLAYAAAGFNESAVAAAAGSKAALEAEWANARAEAVSVLWPTPASVQSWASGVVPLPPVITSTPSSPLNTTPQTRAELVARWTLQVVGNAGTTAEKRAQYAADLTSVHGLMPDELATIEAAIKEEMAAIAAIAAGPSLLARVGAKITAAVMVRTPPPSESAMTTTPAVIRGPQTRQQRQTLTFDEWWAEAQDGRLVPAELLDMNTRTPLHWYVNSPSRSPPPIWMVYYTPEEWCTTLKVTTKVMNQWKMRRRNWGGQPIRDWCDEEQREKLWPGLQ